MESKCCRDGVTPPLDLLGLQLVRQTHAQRGTPFKHGSGHFVTQTLPRFVQDVVGQRYITYFRHETHIFLCQLVLGKGFNCRLLVESWVLT